MPGDCPTGNIPARLCTVEEALEGIVLGAGHPAMNVTNIGSTFAWNGFTQVLNVPVIPAAPDAPDADVHVFATALARAADAPDFIGQIGVQVTDATNGNYSIWVAYGTSVGLWTLKVGSLGAQNAGTVAITGGSVTGITDITVADGGTGASTAPAARVNLRNPSLPPVSNNLDWSLGDNFYRTLASDITITFSNVQDGLSIRFVVTTDTYQITWPVAVQWPSGVTPVGSGIGMGAFRDFYTFHSINGVIYGTSTLAYPP